MAWPSRPQPRSPQTTPRRPPRPSTKSTRSLPSSSTISPRQQSSQGRELLLQDTTYRLSQMLHLLNGDDRASVQGTLAQLNHLNDELPTQVFTPTPTPTSSVFQSNCLRYDSQVKLVLDTSALRTVP